MENDNWVKTLVSCSVVFVALCFAVGYYQQAWLLFRHFGYTASPYALLTYNEILLAGVKSLYLQLTFLLPVLALTVLIHRYVPLRLRRALFFSLLPLMSLLLCAYWQFGSPTKTRILIWLQDATGPTVATIDAVLLFLLLELRSGDCLQRVTSRVRWIGIGVLSLYSFYPLVTTNQYSFRMFLTPASVTLNDGRHLSAVYFVAIRDGFVFLGNAQEKQIFALRTDQVTRIDLINDLRHASNRGRTEHLLTGAPQAPVRRGI